MLRTNGFSRPLALAAFAAVVLAALGFVLFGSASPTGGNEEQASASEHAPDSLGAPNAPNAVAFTAYSTSASARTISGL